MFTCPITQATVISPIEITVCGHLFEKVALLENIVVNGFTCPYCRSAFTRDNLYVSPSLTELLKPKSVGTQTEDIVPELITPEVQPPFRVVNLRDDEFNPNSRSSAKTSESIKFYNRCYPNDEVGLHRYAYQSEINSEKLVGEMLARSGYLIYDIFKIGRSGSLNQYVLYSADKLRSGATNHLSKYNRRRITTRIPSLNID